MSAAIVRDSSFYRDKARRYDRHQSALHSVDQEISRTMNGALHLLEKH